MNNNEQRDEIIYENQDSQAVVSKVFSKVYLWMTMALAITALTAYYLVSSGMLISLLSNRGLFFGLIIAELAVVWYLSARVFRLSVPVATALLILYSVLNGATIGSILLLYAQTTIYTTFGITAGMFGVMSVVGFFTKSDMSKWHRILMMGIVGLIIAGVVNIFVASGPLYWIVSIVGVVIFTILTAVDTQKIKQLAQSEIMEYDENNISRLAILGALTLYLDFVNLFLYLLRILGSRD